MPNAEAKATNDAPSSSSSAWLGLRPPPSSGRSSSRINASGSLTRSQIHDWMALQKRSGLSSK